MQWTVVAIATRGGADGEGVSPSPVSRYDPHTSPPTPPGLRPPASSPAPGGGSHGDIQGKAVPQFCERWKFIQGDEKRDIRIL